MAAMAIMRIKTSAFFMVGFPLFDFDGVYCNGGEMQMDRLDLLRFRKLKLQCDPDAANHSAAEEDEQRGEDQ